MMKKGIRGILLAAGILTLAGGEWTISEARADAGIRQEETGQTPADSEEEIPQEGDGETAVLPDKLRLDDQNVYPGMEKAYQDGYVPAVEENTAAVILPLLAREGSTIQSVTAVSDLGDGSQSPFVFRNYQKTFGKTVEQINGTEQQKEVFLIRFDLELVEERKNGAYPVNIKISYDTDAETEMQQDFTVYVQITDEKVTPSPAATPKPTPTAGPEPSASPEPTPEETPVPSAETPETEQPDMQGTEEVITDGAALSLGGADGGGAVSVAGTGEEKPSPEPKVIITKCTGVPEHIYAGETVEFTAVLKNTNKKKPVQNMTVAITCEAEGIRLKSDSNTFYFDYLGTEKTLEVPLKFQIDEKTAAGKYTVLFALSYDNPDAEPLTSSGQIDLKVEQKNEVEMEVGEIAEEVNAGDSMQIPIQVMNLGRGMVYNVRCSVEVPGLRADKSLFLGNIDGGTAASGEFGVFAGIVNEDAEEADQRYGRTSGRIVLTYEDEDGEETQKFQDMAITIQPLEIRQEETTPEEESGIGKQLAAGIGILILLGGTGCGISVWRRRKVRKGRYE
ncbi:MAG TPA: hypothetical protein IAA57_09655 [Candidatus Pullilachnospira intestinigallinarum]|nr:hypothetical protein [Candidatus Pullilachnospira intestinigallinarum]